MTQILQPWGNSLGVRLSRKITKAARIEAGQALSVTLQGDSIVLTPIHQSIPSLDVLVAQITPDNAHEVIEFGPTQGKEIW
ncbi:MAG: hypothetical protein WBB39_04560 [Candidatus Saccharimonadales bacterium]